MPVSLPASFTRDGFLPIKQIRKGGRRLMIGTDGLPDSGKTEFMLSAPGPGICLCLDRGFDPVFDNGTPPDERQENWGFKVITVPKATAETQQGYIDYWKAFYTEFRKACDNLECRTVGLDGDSDSWELQRLAEFGRLTKVPSILYDNVNAARRAMYARAWDSGKIIIATNKVRKVFKTKYKTDGTPELNSSGNETREWDGESFERQGFGDQEYLWHIQLRHVFKPQTTVFKKVIPQQWGVRIMKCKANPSLVGETLWGSDCNFQTLVQVVYPHVSLEEWGYK